MSESQHVQMYEVEAMVRGNWVSDPVHPWVNLNMEDCVSRDEFRLPSSEWSWASNWKIEKEAGRTDRDGWEFASRFERFLQKDRKPKPEKLWNDKCRRRFWVRTMRREAAAAAGGGAGAGGRTLSGSGKNSMVADVIDKVKNGLSTIHQARVRIEKTMAANPDSVSAEKRNSLIVSVRKNVEDISSMLQVAEQSSAAAGGGKSGGNKATITVLSKLRRDCEKEKDAIEKALQLNGAGAGIARNSSGAASIGTAGSGAADRDRESQESSCTADTMTSAGPGAGGAAGPPQFKKLTLNTNPGASSSGAGAGAGGMPLFSAPGSRTATPTTRPGAGPTPTGAAAAGGSSVFAFRSAAPPPTSSSAAVVHGGKGASSFSMEQLSARHNSSDALDVKDGTYMSQALQQKMIEKKLIGKDEATVMQELIDERSDAIEDIYKGLVDVNKMFHDLSEIVKDNQPQIEEICKNISDSHDITERGYHDIVDANQLQIEGGACIIS